MYLITDKYRKYKIVFHNILLKINYYDIEDKIYWLSTDILLKHFGNYSDKKNAKCISKNMKN